MSGDTQHEDIGARAEDAVLATGDDDGLDFRVLKANAVQGVMQLHVHAQVIAVELELVAGANATVFGNVELHAGDIALHFKRPVTVLAWLGAVIDDGLLLHARLLMR